MSNADVKTPLDVEEARPQTSIAERYRVESLLGEGGAASVYRVRDTLGGRRVALKQLRLSGGAHDALLTSQFEREYHTLSQLAHPSIIEVYDYGVERGRPYYTMELLDGEDLRERGRLPCVEACALLCDVASSLAIVHSRHRVHRDVSARNVRCTRDGHAKLLDFGAMAVAGAVHPLVGTPPFVPPEALQLQPLDARVDLYALGALAYVMLTGRHAYAAQGFSQLRDLWRSPPPTPRQYEPSVPEALDRLVMELLQLERDARPRSAADVMERLAGIAGLTLQELPQVQQAYLAVPMLVGREAQLQQLRGAMVEALQGRGGSILVEAAAGMGRSRMLDAAVLEAKLLGAVVLRADAAKCPAEPYSLCRQLCGELVSALPRLTEQSARPRRALLAHVIPSLAAGDAPAEQPPRRQLQAAMRDFFVAIAREQLIVLAIDQLALADEPSAALVGMLAHGASRRRLCVVVTAAPGEQAPALGLLRQVARPVPLAPLTAEQTRALVQSLFGDVDHLAQVTERLHGLAQGNPGWVMRLCERLVERGDARYLAGRWTLPSELSADAVPDSLTTELSGRLHALPQDARELAQTLALSDPAAFELPDYAALSAHRDHFRTHRALDALVAAGVMAPANARYQFTQPDFVRLLCAQVAPDEARVRHARLAAVLESRNDVALYTHHLLLAGHPIEAVERIIEFAPEFMNSRPSEIARYHGTFSRAIEADVLSPRRRLEASYRLLVSAVFLGRMDTFRALAPAVLEQLKQASGFNELAALPPDKRSEGTEAVLQRLNAQQLQAPAAERAARPHLAIQDLLNLTSVFCGAASNALDLDLLEQLPSLEPLFTATPLAGPMQQMLEISKAALSARTGLALQRSRALVENLRAIAADPRASPQARRLSMAQRYMQGLTLAGAGIEPPAELLAELEGVPGYRAQAWRIRMISQYMRCNFDEARICERRATLVALQDGMSPAGATLRVELVSHICADDPSGVRKCMAATEGMATHFPMWRATLAIARCHQARMQGRLDEALAALQPALELTRVGRNLDWALAMQSRVQVLTELGRAAEAVAFGNEARAQAAAADVPLTPWFRSVLATALLRAGDLATAGELLDGALRELASTGASGLFVGVAHEAQAHLAIAMRDAGALQQALEHCVREFRLGENSVLAARHERLLREASAAGMHVPGTAQFAATTSAAPGNAVAQTVFSRMLTCIGAQERASEVLRLLLEASEARSGYLFGLRAGKLELLCSVDEHEVPPDLAAALEVYLRDELEDPLRMSASAPRSTAALQTWIDSWGREFEQLLLSGRVDGEQVIAGIAALHHENDERPTLSPELLHALTAALIADDAIDPITCVG